MRRFRTKPALSVQCNVASNYAVLLQLRPIARSKTNRTGIAASPHLHRIIKLRLFRPNYDDMYTDDVSPTHTSDSALPLGPLGLLVVVYMASPPR